MGALGAKYEPQAMYVGIVQGTAAAYGQGAPTLEPRDSRHEEMDSATSAPTWARANRTCSQGRPTDS